MNFLIRFNFSSFFKGLAAGSTVYGVGFAEGPKEKAVGVVLFTSEGGTKDGPIHAVRLQIDLNGGEELKVVDEAFDKLVAYLVREGMSVERGILMTEGLQDSLRLYGNAGPTNLKEIDAFLAKKEGQSI
jgi:hypothetical protein